MLLFTEEEYRVMLDELLHREKVSFSMLLHIADKALSPTIKKWCAQDALLHGEHRLEELKLDVSSRLVCTVVDQFLLPHGVEEKGTPTAEEFSRWMFTVAHNVVRDTADRLHCTADHFTAFEDAYLDIPSEEPQPGESLAQREQLQAAVDTVLSVDVGAHKVLTWLAQFLFLLDGVSDKKQATNAIVEQFSNLSLFEMYDLLVAYTVRIPWLSLSDRQQQRLLRRLQKRRANGQAYGEATYRDFYMKKGGRASVSDWLHRMNSMVRRTTKHDAFDG